LYRQYVKRADNM